jgi:muramoyltetrapeptide carboxypeptidase
MSRIDHNKIKVIAPGSVRCTIEMIEQNKRWFESQGYTVELGDTDTYFHNTTIFHSAPDDLRAWELLEAFNNSNCGVVWSLVGGYGSAKLLSYLENVELNTGKLLVGYSDITALGIYLFQKRAFNLSMGQYLLRAQILMRK